VGIIVVETTMFDFMIAALPWIAIGLFAATACAYGDKLNRLWEKWSNSTK